MQKANPKMNSFYFAYTCIYTCLCTSCCSWLYFTLPSRWGRKWCMQQLGPRWRQSLEADTSRTKCSARAKWVESIRHDGRLAGDSDGDCLLSVQDDVCFQGYLRHMSSCCSPPPLSEAELELQKIKVTEVNFNHWSWPLVTFTFNFNFSNQYL